MKDSWGMSEDDDRGTGTSGTSEELGSSTENRIQNNTNVKTKSSPLAVPRTIHNTNTNKIDDFYSTQGPMLLDRTKDHENTVNQSVLRLRWFFLMSRSLHRTLRRPKSLKRFNGPKQKISVKARLARCTKESIAATVKSSSSKKYQSWTARWTQPQSTIN